jgi:hypothetical protein
VAILPSGLPVLKKVVVAIVSSALKTTAEETKRSNAMLK